MASGRLGPVVLGQVVRGPDGFWCVLGCGEFRRGTIRRHGRGSICRIGQRPWLFRTAQYVGLDGQRLCDLRLLSPSGSGVLQRHFQIGLFFIEPCLFEFRRDEPLPIGHRNLVIIRVDFGKCQEAMAVAAIFHERRLEAGLHADDLGEVDVAFELALGGRLDVEIF